MDTREFLRHTLATLAYRCNKTLKDAPEGFADFQTQGIVNTPLMLVSHIADLLEWTLNHSQGSSKYNHSTPSNWDNEIKRFHSSLQRLDDYLAGQSDVQAPLERLFQGPIADALTHVGQLALLRRMAGAPIGGENFFKADIKAGQFDDTH